MAEHFSLKNKRIFIAGHNGMVGKALIRALKDEPCELITAHRRDLDLTRQSSVEDFMYEAKPDAIIIAAAKVGGIGANAAYPAEFLYTNLMIQAHLTHAAYQAGTSRMLFLGSSCIYPKFAPQPMSETALLTGPLEPTNEPYAIAKIAGIKLAAAYRTQYGLDYISAMPTNLYGPEDNFDLGSSHVLPALIRKAHIAKMNRDAAMTLWGSGSPQREFLHVDDCASALIFLLKNYSEADHINIGSQTEISILELAKLVCEIVGFEGQISHDLSKPDGTPRKLMSSVKLNALGWTPSISLKDGIASTYAWFLAGLKSGAVTLEKT